MASRKFLRINGLPVPVAQGQASMEVSQFGNSDVNFQNRPRRDRKGIRKTLTFTTVPSTEDVAKNVQSMLIGRGGKWSFEDRYGVFSSNGFPFLEVGVGNSFTTYAFGGVGVPFGDSGVGLNAISKFGYQAYEIATHAVAQVGADDVDPAQVEWTIFFFVKVGDSTSYRPSRFGWYMANSDGETMFCGNTSNVNFLVPSLDISEVASSLGGTAIKIEKSLLVSWEPLVDDLVLLPWLMKKGDDVAQVFKHLSQWDMRFCLDLENGFNEAAYYNIPIISTMFSSSGSWNFNDIDAAGCPGRFCLDMGNQTDCDIEFAPSSECSNLYQAGVDDSTFYARPRSISIWLRIDALPGPIASAPVASIFSKMDQNAVPADRGFKVSATVPNANDIRITFNLLGGGDGAMTAQATYEAPWMTPAGDDVWVHYLWTLDRVVTSATVVVTHDRLYKNGILVSSGTDGSGGVPSTGEMFWDADADAPWNIGGDQPTASGFYAPADNVKIGSVAVYGWHFSDDDVQDIYQRERRGAVPKKPVQYALTPRVNMSGGFLDGEEMEGCGDVVGETFLQGTPASTNTFESNLRTVGGEIAQAGMKRVLRPTDEVIYSDGVSPIANPFTEKVFPGNKTGTRPALTIITNPSYCAAQANLNATPAPTTRKAWQESGIALDMNADFLVDGPGPFGFDRALWFNGAGGGGFEGTNCWHFEGTPGTATSGARWGEWQEGKSAITLLMWIRPIPSTGSPFGLFQSTVLASGASKIRFEYNVAGTMLASGRSNDGGTFSTLNGVGDVYAASEDGTKWIQVGMTIDPENNNFTTWINGSEDATGLTSGGFNQNSFDNSHNRTRIGKISTSSEAEAWIYSLQFFSRRLLPQEVQSIYTSQKGFFIINADRGRIE